MWANGFGCWEAMFAFEGMLFSFIHSFAYLFVLDESAADDTITGK